MKIIVVEGEERIREGIHSLIDMMEGDWEFAGEAENGADGLELLRRVKPDAVITDIRMPEMGGLEMIKAARNEGINAKAIVVSAYSEFEYAREALNLGASDYLLKPIAVDEFFATLDRVKTQIEREASKQPDMLGGLEKILAGFIYGQYEVNEEICGYLSSRYHLEKDSSLIVLCIYLGSGSGRHNDTVKKEWEQMLKSAGAGSQKYGALVWSGDIASSFSSMRNQLAAGLNMGMAGIPWWTTDIGGFHGGDPNDPAFRELFVRWFQWGTFCPVMRLHGDREPRQPQFGTTGGAACCSGADNEVWSYGEEVYKICEKYMLMREALRNYTRELMYEAHETGAPVMRTLFYEFPEDKTCWEVEDEYMYGSRYLVAPILEAGVKTRRVYLPAGCGWELQETDEKYEGGTWTDVPVTLETMPVFVRIG